MVIILPSFPNVLHTLLGTNRKATRRKDDTEEEEGNCQENNTFVFEGRKCSVKNIGRAGEVLE